VKGFNDVMLQMSPGKNKALGKQRFAVSPWFL
jgi:hypothetical protein